MTHVDDSRRLLRWEACFNARDIGGYPTSDGGRTGWGALVRSDNLCRLTPAGCAALIAYGVRTIIDVRFVEELELQPHPFREPSGPADRAALLGKQADVDGHGPESAQPASMQRPRYLHMPINAGRDTAAAGENDAAFAAARSLAELYTVNLASDHVGIGRIVSAVAAAPDGGVVIHCHAGKDRTGLIIALLLSVIGVPAEVIAADYALSAACLAPELERWRASQRWRDPNELALQEWGLGSDPQSMLATLAHLDDRYRGAETYLLSAGVAPETLEVLRARLRA